MSNLRIITRTHKPGAAIAKILDAQRRFVRASVFPITIGTAAGLVLSFAASGVLRRLVFGVAATDPITDVASAAALVAVAAVASWWPARRAAQIDPVATMRPE